MDSYAPVLIPTLNRVTHFVNCISSLLECEGSRQTDLYVALDYPSKESHWEGYNMITQFINQIQGFKSVFVIKRESNLGAHRNFHEALAFLFQKHETVIFTEDDNVFSKDFLLYINKCLKVYKEDKNVFSICGYNYPVKMPKSYRDEIYLWQGFSAWGVGLWRDKFLKIDWNETVVHQNVSKFFKNYYNVVKFNQIANIYIPALFYMHSERLIHTDIVVCMDQYLNKKYSIFPAKSRVRNRGNDGSGENCISIEDDIYANQEIYQGTSDYVISRSLLPDNEINKVLELHFRRYWKVNLRFFLKIILMNIGILNECRNLKNKLIA